jgi:ribosomal protein S18 acetylase RimI-like enzyme
VQVTQFSSPLMQPQRVGRVGSVCVDESVRGQGIGRALMQCAQTWAAEQNAVDLRLTVWAFNAPALRLYEELGYEVRAFEMGKRLEENSRSSRLPCPVAFMTPPSPIPVSPDTDPDTAASTARPSVDR